MKENYWVSDHEGLRTDQRTILNEYLNRVKFNKRSSSTIDGYRKTLEKFLGDNTIPLKELRQEAVWEWVLTKYPHMKVGSRNNILTALSMFFKFCEDEGYMGHVLVKRYWRGRRPKAVPKFLPSVN